MENTKDKILQTLTDARQNLKSGKQISDAWIAKRSEKMIKHINDDTTEDVLNELINDAIDDMEETQGNINRVLADIAKQQKTTPQSKKEDVLKPEEKLIDDQKVPFEMPDEYKSMFETWQKDQMSKSYASKRSEIANVATGLTGTQKTAFIKYLDGFNPNLDIDATVLAGQYKSSFTDIFGSLPIENTGVGGASGGNKADLEREQIAMYQEIAADLANRVY